MTARTHIDDARPAADRPSGEVGVEGRARQENQHQQQFALKALYDRIKTQNFIRKKGLGIPVLTANSIKEGSEILLRLRECIKFAFCPLNRTSNFFY